MSRVLVLRFQRFKMRLKYLITYCEDKPQLQNWLGANYESLRDVVFLSHNGYTHQTNGYNFMQFDKCKTIKNQDETKTLAFIAIRNQRQLDVINASPLDVLSSVDPSQDPYQNIINNTENLAKFRQVISETRQDEEFGGNIKFCAI